MVYIIHDCHCGSCPGSQPAKPREDGQMIFGGSLCNCSCHNLTGKEREDFIQMKYNLLLENDCC